MVATVIIPIVVIILLAHLKKEKACRSIPYHYRHTVQPRAWYPSIEYVCVLPLSRAQLFATSWTAIHQVPLSMRFSRQGYWSGLPFPSPGDLPNPGIEPRFPALQADSLPTELQGKPSISESKGRWLESKSWIWPGFNVQEFLRIFKILDIHQPPSAGTLQAQSTGIHLTQTCRGWRVRLGGSETISYLLRLPDSAALRPSQPQKCPQTGQGQQTGRAQMGGRALLLLNSRPFLLVLKAQ